MLRGANARDSITCPYHVPVREFMQKIKGIWNRMPNNNIRNSI